MFPFATAMMMGGGDIPFPDVPPEKVILHLGRNTSNYTGANIQWNEELVDTYGAFAPTSDTVTIPAGMNGKLVRLVGNQNLAQDHGTNFVTGTTAAMPGWPIRSINNGTTFGAQIHNWASGPFTPATGQTILVRNYYESAGALLNATLVNYNRNFLVMEELDANTARCVAYKTATQSIPSDTSTAVVFEALTENNTGEFALAPGGTGIIIPRSGYYRLFCNFQTDTPVGTSQTVEAVTLIDGAFHTGGADQTRRNKAYHGEGGVSAGVYIAKGQVVSLSAYHNDAGTANLVGSGRTFLSIEQLPAGMKRTIATTDGTQSIAAAGTDTNIQYKGAHLFTNCGTEIHDPAGADPTAFVCPAGCNRGGHDDELVR